MDKLRFTNLRVAIPILLLFLLPGWLQVQAQKFRALKWPVGVAAAKAPLQAAGMSQSVLLSEDFEGVDASDAAHQMPEGWTSTAASGALWMAGPVTMDGDLMPAKSGSYYAYVITDAYTDGDAWAMSPKFHMEAGVRYIVRFWAILYNYDDKAESLKVYIGDSPTADAMTEEIYVSDGREISSWEKVEVAFTPDKTGDYYLGLHSETPAGVGVTLVDDIQVVKDGCAAIDAASSLDLGTKLDLGLGAARDYVVSNIGTEPLEVSLQQASQGVEVKGLPVTVEPGTQAVLQILFTSDVVGDYAGTVDFATNDPGAQTVRLSVTGRVTKARVSEGYHFEDFEGGWPEGWDKYEGVVCTAGDGIDGSRSTYCQSLTGENWFKTHFVKFGDSPKLVVNYKLKPNDIFGLGMVPEVVSKDNVEMRFYVSDDYGATFTEVDSIIPSKGTYITESKDYVKYTVDLAGYAGKTCIIMIETNSTDVTDIMTGVYDTFFDNIEIGSRNADDLSAAVLKGDSRLYEKAEGTYSVDVSNLGSNGQSGYKVRLEDREGNVIAETEGPDIAAGETAMVTLKWTPETKGAYHLHANVSLDGDEDTGNNQSTELQVLVMSDKQQFAETSKDNLVTMQEPFMMYNPGVSQTIYYANEIGADAAMLNSIEYISYADAAFTTQELTLWVGETDKADFSDNQIVPVGQLTKVFEGKVHIEAGTNPLVIPFDTPYEYKGKNLVVYATNITSEFLLEKYFAGTQDDVQRSIKIEYSGHDGMTAENPGTAEGDATSGNCPYVRFGYETGEAGELTGRVTDKDGALEGAKVQVKGTEYYATTGKDGRYSLKNVSASGDKTLVCSKYGYVTQEVAGINITGGAVVEQDIVMTAVTLRQVKGKVLSEETGLPIAGAKVTLKGYDTYSAETDAQGEYAISGVYDLDDAGYGDYAVTVGAAYYQPYQGTLTVKGGDVDATFSLEEGVFPVRNAAAAAGDGKAVVSWDAPMPEFRHDSGDCVDGFGFGDYDDKCVFGAVWNNNVRLYEVSWYLSSTEPADEVTLYIFKINPDGSPTKDILFQKSVPTGNDTWSTYQFDTPIDLPDGFCIALGSKAFLGIGACVPTEEYPLEYGMYWYCGGFDRGDMVPWYDIQRFSNNTLMLRAIGEDYGPAAGAAAQTAMKVQAATAKAGVKPVSKSPASRVQAGSPVYKANAGFGSSLVRSYSVYRLHEGDDESLWTLVGDGVTELEFTDTQLGGQPEGAYQYAVKANYTDKSSAPVLTNTVESTSTGIDGTAAVKEVAGYVVADTSGAIVKRGGSDAAGGVLDGLASGVYIVKVEYADGTTEMKKLLKK